MGVLAEHVLENSCKKKRNQTVIWHKPLTNYGYMERASGTQPPPCRSDDNLYVVWGMPKEAVIVNHVNASFLLIQVDIVLVVEVSRPW